MKALIILAVCLVAITGNGQPLKALHVGDTLPAVSLTLVNGTNHTKVLPDSNYALTLLAFWSPSCSFSASELYRLAALQKQVPDTRLLPVSFDVRQGSTVEQFIERKRATAKAVSLASAVQTSTDSLVTTLFPFRGVPHYIWLNAGAWC